MFDYLDPKLTVRRFPIDRSGVLHRLERLAYKLSEDFRWSKAEAVAFILAGRVPFVHIATYRLSLSDPPCMSRITLTLDPALSPRQVEGIYRNIRSRALSGRYRNISNKHAVLAAFAAEHEGETTLSAVMASWNKRYPRWRYKAVTNFGRDAKAARERLLYPTPFSLQAVLLGGDSGKTKKR